MRHANRHSLQTVTGSIMIFICCYTVEPPESISNRAGFVDFMQAVFCEACACWVPLPPDQHTERENHKLSGDRREVVWKRHLRGDRHAREVAARLAEEAQLDSTHHYRSAHGPHEYLSMQQDWM